MAENNPANPTQGDRAQVSAGGPVFVVGSMRSGSTMLRLILDSHPNIAIGAETGFMGAVMAAKSIPNWRNGDGWYRRLDWTEPEFNARLREFYAGVFRRYAEARGKQRWGEKTPFHTGHIAEMAQIFPDAVFVGIVRHPGGVAASLRKSFHYSFADALSYWSGINLDLVRAGTDLGDRFVLCRYEDLLTDGEPVLRELMGWLGEPWSPRLLEHHRVQQEQGAPRVVDGSTITRDAIDDKRASNWLRTATEADQVALESTARLGGYFGYQAVDPSVRGSLLPTGVAGRWLPNGDELMVRRRAWSDEVDFDERPETLFIDASIEELADRALRAERALARTRTRTSVRMSDAFRKVQRGRSLQDVRDAWALVRTKGR